MLLTSSNSSSSLPGLSPEIWVISVLSLFTFSYHHLLCETIMVPLHLQGHSRVSYINGALWNCVRWDITFGSLGGQGYLRSLMCLRWIKGEMNKNVADIKMTLAFPRTAKAEPEYSICAGFRNWVLCCNLKWINFWYKNTVMRLFPHARKTEFGHAFLLLGRYPLFISYFMLRF